MIYTQIYPPSLRVVICKACSPYFRHVNGNFLWITLRTIADILSCDLPFYFSYTQSYLNRPDFIETRRAGLERYIQQLTRVPHVRDEPEFLQFINMFVAKRLEFSVVSNMGVFTCSVGPHLPSLQISLESNEYSFVFPGSKPLGLVFRCERPTDMNVETYVVNFKSSCDTKGVAESSGRIKVGDCLTRINGRAVLGKLCYRDIITTIRTFRARHGDLVPLLLHFRRRSDGDSVAEGKKVPDSETTTVSGHSEDDDVIASGTKLDDESEHNESNSTTTVVSEI